LSTRDSVVAQPGDADAGEPQADESAADAADTATAAEHAKRNGADTPSVGLDLFRHPIAVELEGSYADMVRYLARIEGSEWSLMWHELKIDTLEYPRARLRFVVYSFSLEEAWIGV